MNVDELLIEAFDRIRGIVYQAVDGLTPEQLAYRPDEEANSIAWLVWHLTRIQDDHVAAVAQIEQVWTAEGWSARFALPFDASETGYGHGADDVAAVEVSSGDLLTGYYDAVHERTKRFLADLSADDLDGVVDESFDPPVTLGVRLVSVLGDDLQHGGQASYLHGLVIRR
jgi:hypothetical protein